MIKDFLTDREQCVKLGNSISSWKKLNGGLPQGTKLGPLLFIILINSLLVEWHGQIKFVDDSSVLEIIPRCSPSLLPNVVNDISNFPANRGMELNSKNARKWRYLFYNINYRALIQSTSQEYLSKEFHVLNCRGSQYLMILRGMLMWTVSLKRLMLVFMRCAN